MKILPLVSLVFVVVFSAMTVLQLQSFIDNTATTETSIWIVINTAFVVWHGARVVIWLEKFNQ